MKVVIAGGTGLIGQALARHFVDTGDEVLILSRQHRPLCVGDSIYWDGRSRGGWIRTIDGAHAVINLCGASIGAKRWTRTRKAMLVSSRVEPSRALADGCAHASDPPSVLLQASGVGYYGPSTTGVFDESSPPGQDYLARLAQAWETAGEDLLPSNVRRVVMRTGVVWCDESEAVRRILAPFRFFIGGTLGTGQQFLSWIHMDDLVAAVDLLVRSTAISGPVNLTAPETPNNSELARAIARALNRPNWLPVPAAALRLALGEMSMLVLTGQRVVPAVLEGAGFRFAYPNIESATRRTPA